MALAAPCQQRPNYVEPSALEGQQVQARNHQVPSQPLRLALRPAKEAGDRSQMVLGDQRDLPRSARCATIASPSRPCPNPNHAPATAAIAARRAGRSPILTSRPGAIGPSARRARGSRAKGAASPFAHIAICQRGTTYRSDMNPCTHPKDCSSPTWNQPPCTSPNTRRTGAFEAVRTITPPPGWPRMFTGRAAVVAIECVAMAQSTGAVAGGWRVAERLGVEEPRWATGPLPAAPVPGEAGARAAPAGVRCSAVLGPPLSKQWSILSL
jgi:hypothetical protein